MGKPDVKPFEDLKQAPRFPRHPLKSVPAIPKNAFLRAFPQPRKPLEKETLEAAFTIPNVRNIPKRRPKC
jgi:hypothetical protein